MADKFIVKGSNLFHWDEKKEEYFAVSLRHVVDVVIDPDDCICLSFDRTFSASDGQYDNIVHKYYNPGEIKQKIYLELKEYLKKKKTAELFTNFLTADPVASPDSLYRRAEQAFKILAENDLEDF